jgi:hypothetical protein
MQWPGWPCRGLVGCADKLWATGPNPKSNTTQRMKEGKAVDVRRPGKFGALSATCRGSDKRETVGAPTMDSDSKYGRRQADGE